MSSGVQLSEARTAVPSCAISCFPRVFRYGSPQSFGRYQPRTAHAWSAEQRPRIEGHPNGGDLPVFDVRPVGDLQRCFASHAQLRPGDDVVF